MGMMVSFKSWPLCSWEQASYTLELEAGRAPEPGSFGESNFISCLGNWTRFLGSQFCSCITIRTKTSRLRIAWNIFGNDKRRMTERINEIRERMVGSSRLDYKRKMDLIFANGTTTPSGPGRPHFSGFTNTFRHSTLGRTPLDEWSGRRRDVYPTTHKTHRRQNSFATGGILTRNPSKLAAADTRLRLRGHCGQLWMWYSI